MVVVPFAVAALAGLVAGCVPGVAVVVAVGSPISMYVRPAKSDIGCKTTWQEISTISATTDY